MHHHHPHPPHTPPGGASPPQGHRPREPSRARLLFYEVFFFVNVTAPSQAAASTLRGLCLGHGSGGSFFGCFSNKDGTVVLASLSPGVAIPVQAFWAFLPQARSGPDPQAPGEQAGATRGRHSWERQQPGLEGAQG